MNLSRIKLTFRTWATLLLVSFCCLQRSAQAQTLIYDSSTTPLALSSGQFTDIHGGVAAISGSTMVLTPDTSSSSYLRDFVLRPASEDATNGTVVVSLPANAFASSNASVGAIARYNRTTSSTYLGQYSPIDGHSTIYKITNGSSIAVVGTSISVSPTYNAAHTYNVIFSANGGTLTLTVVDTTANAIVNVHQETDSSPLTGSGAFGIDCWSNESGGSSVSTISAFRSYSGLYNVKLVVCYGNSITYGYLVGGGQISSPYPAQLQTTLGRDYVVVNGGYSGQSGDYLDDDNPYPSGTGNGIATGTWESNGGSGTSPLAATNALYNTGLAGCYMIYMEGTNSIYQSNAAYGPNGYAGAGLSSATGQTTQDIFNRIKAFGTAETGIGWHFYVCTTIACNATPSGQTTAFNSQITALNTLISGDHSWAAGMIDVHGATVSGSTVFATVAETANSTYFQSDGTHETPTGAGVISNLVAMNAFGVGGSVTTALPNANVYSKSFRQDGSNGYIESNSFGGKILFGVTGSATISINVSSPSPTKWKAIVDGTAQSAVSCAAGTNIQITLASGLGTSGTRQVAIVETQNDTSDGDDPSNTWSGTPPTHSARVSSIVTDSGSTLSAPSSTPSTIAFFMTDSLGVYNASDGTSDSTKSYPSLLCDQLGWYLVARSFGGQTYYLDRTASNIAPPVYTPGNSTKTTIASWDSINAFTSGEKNAANYVVLAEGTNDEQYGVSGANLQARVQATVTQARVVFPNAKIIVMEPLSVGTGTDLSSYIAAGFYAAADSNSCLVPVNPALYSGSLFDGVHLTQAAQSTAVTNDLLAKFTTAETSSFPAVTSQPANQTITTGNTATFTAAFSGTPTPGIQWRQSTDSGTTWTNISGAVSGSYTTGTLTTGQSGYEYDAVATNVAGTVTTSAATVTVSALPQVATPTFSPVASTYTGTQTVTISTSTSASTIYYTVDGSTPTTSSSVYSSAISVPASETLKAIAVAGGYTNSAVGIAAYTITALSQVAMPTFSPTGGTYSSAQTVTVSTSTSGATIYYTLDGSTPTTSSSVYSSAITVSSSESIKALGVKGGMTNSSVAVAAYTITSGGGGSALHTTDAIDPSFPAGVTALQEMEQIYVIDQCQCHEGAVNPSTHQQALTYYAADGATVLATGTITFDSSNVVKQTRSRLTLNYNNFATASGNLLGTTVLDNTLGGHPVAVADVQRREDAIRAGASTRTVAALVDTATFGNQGGTTIFTSVITTHNDGSADRTVTHD